jgi:sugar O-acyltransferase (sialic acid O-acetyltransferase NeuD family)
MPTELLVIGGGGHAKVVIDIAQSSGWSIAGVLDDAPGAAGQRVMGHRILGGTDLLRGLSDSGRAFVIAIGSNSVRQRLQEIWTKAGLISATLVHPSAVVASSAILQDGTVVMAGAIVNPEARVGRGVILNTASVVEHDCVIGDYCHVAPGASLCGGVTVGARSLVGVGASVTPGITIGSDCVIGAGAAVVADVPDQGRFAGVPARSYLNGNA